MRLWDKGGSLNSKIHAFTVGEEYITDLDLVRFDVLGSAAHARVLAQAKIITEEELNSLLAGLRKILLLHTRSEFVIKPEQEDCHTAIEEQLTNELGDVGRKIHTGRSRNDQVMVAMRLLLRQRVVDLLEGLVTLARSFEGRYYNDGEVPMPGYTHLQLAMPSSIGMWLHSFLEGSMELISDGRRLLEALDSNPSEVASGFGVPLALDRELSSKLLGFARTQRNPINVISSRGRHELKVARWVSDIAGLLERFAWDMVLFCTKEFGFFSLPSEFTTGSSIMPQKRNPDVVELMRGKAGKMRALELEILLTIAKLPSNYHREFQYTKEPVIKSLNETELLLEIASEVAKAFLLNKERLASAMAPELYATYDVYRSVRSGKPFRQAYLETAERAEKIDVSSLKKDFKVIADRIAMEFKESTKDLAAAHGFVIEKRHALKRVEESILSQDLANHED